MISSDVLNLRLTWLKRIASSTADSYGKPLETFLPSGSTACAITSARRSNAVFSSNGGREIAYSHVLYADPDLALTEDDRITVGGMSYRIVQCSIEAGRGNHIRAGLVSVKV